MDVPTALPLSRREARRYSRREAILDVARASFAKHGYAGTTMSAVAAAMGGSKGTLWSYFPSKERLFEAVLDRGTSALRAQLSLVLNPADDVEVALRRFCLAFVERITSSQAVELNRLVLGEVNRIPEVGRIFYDRAHVRMQALLAAYLESAMASGRLRRDDPMAAAQLLIGLCMINGHRRLLVGNLARMTPELIEHDASRAMDVFSRVYAPGARDHD